MHWWESSSYLCFFLLSKELSLERATFFNVLMTGNTAREASASSSTKIITLAHFLTHSWSSFLFVFPPTQIHRKSRKMIMFHKGTGHASISLGRRQLDYCHSSTQNLSGFYRKFQRLTHQVLPKSLRQPLSQNFVFIIANPLMWNLSFANQKQESLTDQLRRKINSVIAFP